MVPSISYVVREFVKSRLLDYANGGFNELIPQTSATYGVAPLYLKVGTTLYIGRFDLSSINRSTDPINNSIAIMSVAKSDAIDKNAMRITPSIFSGVIPVSIDFYVIYDSGPAPCDGESNYHAIEDAVFNTFADPASFQLTPPGVIYNNECMVEAGKMNPEGTRWWQQIACTLIFRYDT